MRSAYQVLARGILAATALQIALVNFGVSWDEHAVTHGKTLDAGSYMDNAGFGLGWLVGHAIVPLLAIALVAVAFRARIPHGMRRALVILGCTIVAVLLGAVTATVPAVGVLCGLTQVAVLGLAALAGTRTVPQALAETSPAV